MNVNKPQPNHGFIRPKFTLHKLTRGDIHLGAILRTVEDYAQDERGKYGAILLVLCFFKFVVQIGFTINKGK